MKAFCRLVRLQAQQSRQIVWVVGALLGLGLTAPACRTSQAVSTPNTPRAEAQAYLQQNQPKRALPLLEQAWAAEPEDFELAREIASTAVRAQEGDGLLARVELHQRLSEPMKLYVRGLVRFTRAAEANAALADFERAASLLPSQPELQYRWGLALLEAERYEQALAPLQQAVRLAPTFHRARLALAKALVRQERMDEGLEQLRLWVQGGPEARDLATAKALMDSLADPFLGFPKAAEERLERGLAWLEKADVPQEALLAFEDILREFPDLAVVHALCGLAYQRLDDGARALESFRRAIELQPRQGKFQLYLGELYRSRQRPEQARQAFEHAVRLNPLLETAYMRLGELALERQDYPAAHTAYRTLCALAPRASAYTSQFAAVLQLQGDYLQAERLLLELHHREPLNVEHRLRLGLLATERARKALSLAERKQFAEQAREWLRGVLEAQPENAVASRALQSLGAP